MDFPCSCEAVLQARVTPCHVSLWYKSLWDNQTRFQCIQLIYLSKAMSSTHPGWKGAEECFRQALGSQLFIYYFRFNMLEVSSSKWEVKCLNMFSASKYPIPAYQVGNPTWSSYQFCLLFTEIFSVTLEVIVWASCYADLNTIILRCWIFVAVCWNLGNKMGKKTHFIRVKRFSYDSVKINQEIIREKKKEINWKNSSTRITSKTAKVSHIFPMTIQFS